MQGTQYATKRSILCRGAFCGPTVLLLSNKGAVQTANHRGKQNSTLYRYMYSVAELA